MPIIIDHCNTADFPFELETPVRVLEDLEGRRDFLERNLQLECNRRRRECVVYVVLAGNRQMNLAQRLVSELDRERRTEVAVVFDIERGNVRLRSHSVGDPTSFDLRKNQLHVRVIQADYGCPIKRNFVREVRETLNNIVHSFVGFHVFLVDVCE